MSPHRYTRFFKSWIILIAVYDDFQSIFIIVLCAKESADFSEI